MKESFLPDRFDVTKKKYGRAQQPTLARLAMHNNFTAAAAASLSPPSTASSPDLDRSEGSDSRHAIPDVVLPPPAISALAHANPGPFGSAHSRAETPEYALFSRDRDLRSAASTAQSSPRIPPVGRNSSNTPRVRPHATTLNIPGMTRSRASPDGRIPQRDVAAKLVIVMVGLPARGKSYLTKKLSRYLSWQQHDTRIFNVGNRRRVAAGVTFPPSKHFYKPSGAAHVAQILLNGAPAPIVDEPTELDLNAPAPPKEAEDTEEGRDDVNDHSANFFDPNNEKASMMREQLAVQTLDELLDYLINQGGAVGILDATNSTIHRRRVLFDHIKAREPKLGILLLESVCNDKNLLEANMRLKLSGPDYRDKDPVKSLKDFRRRVLAYESAYEPLGDYEEQHDMQYIKMIDVGRKVIHHRLRGFLTTNIGAYLSSFNLAPRQIWITRHGKSEDNAKGRIGGDSCLTESGQQYSLALYNFVTHKRQEWLIEQKSKIARSSFPPQPGDHTPPYPEMNQELDDKNCCVWTSMLQRSIETSGYFENDDDYDVKNWEMLNELNAGQFEGLTYEQIATKFPEEFKKREEDKLNYIYPGVGGEGYLKLISRLRDMVRELERITDHVLIIGHRSVCRVLMAYFMDLTHQDIADLDVPLGIVYSIEPKPYGMEFHAFKYDEATSTFHELPNYKPQKAISKGDS